jgi:hypothetical protein
MTTPCVAIARKVVGIPKVAYAAQQAVFDVPAGYPG